jgi:uracil phosphoribosyltransferase
MNNLTLVNHPLVQDALTKLRSKKSTQEIYRSYTDLLTTSLIYEATRTISIAQKTIHTPLAEMKASIISEHIALFTILRAGLAMLNTALKIFPASPVGLAGLERDEKTAIAHEYYWKMPKVKKDTLIILLDPMLATGGSALYALRKLTAHPYKKILLICIIAAPEGIKAVHEEFPQVQITTASIDRKLNAQKFIMPGLGDFGDRYFGTERDSF